MTDCIVSADADAAVPIDAVMRAYREVDDHTSRFASATGVRCPDGCGACCHSPHVEATEAELSPLARELLERGDIHMMLDRLALARESHDRRCVLFMPTPEGDETRGRCSAYAWRPTMCRLFGFAGQRGPDGEPRFTPCRRHVDIMPDVITDVRRSIEDGRISLPILSDLASRVRSATPPGPLLPINEALEQALMRAAMTARLSAAMLDGDSPDDDDGDDRRPPARPAGPRVRRAA